MPREDVPYPGAAICSIKERIEEIADEVDEKLETINGVPGDGSGNVKILSGHAAVVITNDALQNEVSVGLDTTQLPAATVSSVNGQTGAVVLDGTDIAVGAGFNNATHAINALKTATTQNANNLLTETTNRQNADAALQSNINAALATIPSEAATAVQNDPTVQQLSSDVTALQAADSNNVKLSGSQTIIGIKGVPLQTTGNFDDQIASSQKVKNELDAYSPMVRTSGNQSIAGIKTFESAPVMQICGGGYKMTSATYLKCGTITNYGDNTYVADMIICERTAVCIARATVTVSSGAVSTVSLSGRTLYGSATRVYVGACVGANGIDLYCHTDTVNRYFAPSVMGCFYSNGNMADIVPDNTLENTQPAGYVESIFTEA